MTILWRLSAVLLGGLVLLVALAGCMQRRLLYFPSHVPSNPAATAAGLTPWKISGDYVGYAREVPTPRKVWLVLHGNAGQASQRGYLVARLNPADAVYVLEYPGYGDRPGKPSRPSFDAAAQQAYDALVRAYGSERVAVLGESLGSGPACRLAAGTVPPRQIALVVPFDRLVDVAREKVSFLPVGLIMLDRWDNITALQGYTGRLDIFGGTFDQVIPVAHARALAASHPGAVYHEFRGDHNWSASAEVNLSEL